MDDAARHLYDCTKRLYFHLKEGLPKKERESYIAVIQELLEERQQWIDRAPVPFHGEKPEFGKEILAWDRAIQEMLEMMFEEIREDLHRFQRQKTSHERYKQPYQNTSSDGMFLDKRK